jgi:hypothetical protein
MTVNGTGETIERIRNLCYALLQQIPLSVGESSELIGQLSDSSYGVKLCSIVLQIVGNLLRMTL